MKSPMELVRSSCLEVVAKASTVTIDDKVIAEQARKLGEIDNADLQKEVCWDAQGWHYCADVSSDGPLTVQYVFVMDALNFCFWPSPTGFEYDTLAVSLKNVLEADSSAFSADNLAVINEDTLRSWFPVDNMIPNIPERVKRLQEVGSVLLSEFGGLASNMVDSACHSAVKLVELVLNHFPGFRDTTAYDGETVHFYKRAQIFVGDVWAAYGRSTDPSQRYSFYDMDQITMFADYRVPQILRHMGILCYSAEVSARVDTLIELPAGSLEEVEIRAATVIAVERLQQEIQRNGRVMLVLELDWLLWQEGEAMKNDIKPHHRTLTTFY